MNTIDGIIEDLELEESYVGGCTTKGEIILCLENLKVLQKEKESVLKALIDIKAKVEDTYGVTDTRTRRLMIDKYEVLDWINQKIKEIKNERSDNRR